MWWLLRIFVVGGIAAITALVSGILDLEPDNRLFDLWSKSGWLVFGVGVSFGIAVVNEAFIIRRVLSDYAALEEIRKDTVQNKLNDFFEQQGNPSPLDVQACVYRRERRALEGLRKKRFVPLAWRGYEEGWPIFHSGQGIVGKVEKAIKRQRRLIILPAPEEDICIKLRAADNNELVKNYNLTVAQKDAMYGVQSGLAFPLHNRRGRFVGVLAFHSPLEYDAVDFDNALFFDEAHKTAREMGWRLD